MRVTVNILQIIVTLPLVLFFYSCDESLPEYKEPQNVLMSSIINPIDGSTYNLNVTENHATEPPRVTISGSSTLMVRMRVKNNYDEVIEDSAYVGGYIKIEDVTNPGNFIIQNIKYTDVKPFPGKLGEIIRIRPGEQFDVDVECEFKNTDGIYIWLGKESIEQSSGYVTYKVFPLRIRGYLRLYKKLGPIISQSIIINLAVAAKVYYPG